MVSVIDRLSTHSQKTESGCLLWTGTIHRTGYGHIKVDGQTRGAHVVSYEQHVGPVPEGLILDHTCHDPDECVGGWSCLHRRCINPEHLEPVTQLENQMRGKNGRRVNRELEQERKRRWANRRVICEVCGEEGAQQHRARHARRHSRK